MAETRRCDGKTFLGFTVEACDKPATRHAYQDRYGQYDFCERHYYFWLHGHYPEEELKSDGKPDNLKDADHA